MRPFRFLPALALVAGALLFGCGPSESTSIPVPEGKTGGDWPPSVIPDQVPPSAAAGTVLWQRFRTDHARLGAQALVLRQGSSFNRFVEVRIEPRIAGGLKPNTQIKVARDTADPPLVVLKSYDPGPSRTESATFGDGYVMKLELGPVVAGQVTGTIFLAVPDAHQSVVAGTFVAADVRDDPAAVALGDKDLPCVYGRIAVRNAEAGQVGAAYAGTNLKGERKWSAIALPFEAVVRSAANTTFRPRVTQLEFGTDGTAAYHHVSLESGTYLVSASWKGRVADWRWVTVAGSSKDRIDLSIDPTNVGRLEVSLTAALAKESVRLIPADSDGQVPIPVSAVSSDQKLEAMAKDGKATFDGLAPGPYRVFAGTVSLPAKVQAKGTTQVEFK